jgi:hypothetical protein
MGNWDASDFYASSLAFDVCMYVCMCKRDGMGRMT